MNPTNRQSYRQRWDIPAVVPNDMLGRLLLGRRDVQNDRQHIQ
jgi:hypothetical protein